MSDVGWFLLSILLMRVGIGQVRGAVLPAVRIDVARALNWLRSLGVLTVVIAVLAMTGCVRFEARPIAPDQTADAFSQRSLADRGLADFLGANGIAGTENAAWDLDRLTLAAFHFHTDMELAMARWRAALAGEVTAGQRPNPTLAFTPRLNSTSLGTGLTPWILGGVLDVPVETMGKRKHRVAQARHLGDQARLELAGSAWRVRNRVRSSLLALQAAQETAVLRRQQVATLGRLALLVERQWQAGSVSPLEMSTARMAQQHAELSLLDTRRQEVDARGQLAEAVGVPIGALESAVVSFIDIAAFPTNLIAKDVQRKAMLNRADVLGALAHYAAIESALQLQIARQYPDLHLRPGYELDQNKNKWQLGLSLDLPILNQNQGPIAEAEAKRQEAAARFLAVQAQVIGEIERASSVYAAGVEQALSADRLVANLEQRAASATRQFEAGETDRLAATVAEADLLHGSLQRLQARLQAQQSLAALEHAVQAPLLLPGSPAAWETTTGNANHNQKP